MGLHRLQALQENLVSSGMDACLLTHSRDIFYYTGTAQPGYLLVTPGEVGLYIRRNLAFAGEDTCLGEEALHPVSGLSQVLQVLQDKQRHWKVLGLELDVLPANQYLRFREALPDVTIVDAAGLVLRQRMEKDDGEIAAMRHAARIVAAGHEKLKTLDPAGMTELQVAAAIENAHRLQGHEGVFFMRRPDFFMSRGPFSSGENLWQFSGIADTVTGVGLSPALPGGPSGRVIAPGDLLVTDIPTCYRGYHADQSRTYSAGAASAAAEDLYRQLQETFYHGLSLLKAGACCRDIYHGIMEFARRLPFGEHFLFCGDTHARLIGHGIGLELNEPPLLSAGDKTLLGENFTLALEMHAFDPAVGCCKIEETVLITKGEPEILTLEPAVLQQLGGA